MLLVLILIALLQPLALRAQSASLGIDAGSGVQMVQVDRGRGNAVFSLSALRSLGTVETTARGARLIVLGDTLIFEFGSPYVRAGKKVYQLIAPTQQRANQVLVSTQLLTELLPRKYPERIAFAGNVLRTKSRPEPSPIAPSAVPSPSTSTSPSTSKRVVIIDAGHGGVDPGKVGPNGLAEKNVTLTVATKLGALLRDAGYEIHFTRTTDTLIALSDRPRLANQWKNGRPATLFVSIHANSGASAAHGFETYFLSEARTEDERRVAEMENAAVSYEDRSAVKAPALDQLLLGLRNDYYQRASNDFAEVIQRELAPFHPGPSRGVKQAGFRVLVGAVMPAVLVEIAFISNPAEARMLGTAAFQDKIAYSLSRSIASFFDSHQHLWSDVSQ
jgi:N-acetylmuramoyl-L-alanine amidase